MNRLLQASLLAFALAAAPAFAADAKGYASVNGKAIPKVRADALIAAQVAQGQPDSEDLRKAVKEELVRREVLAQEAQKKGVDKKSEIQGQLDLARQGVLVGAYLNDYVRSHPVSDEAVKKEYEVIKKALGDKEYKARHVLVENEADAKAIIEKLGKGEKFEDLAKQSKDPGSKDRGGDLDWNAPGGYVKPFADAMTKLAKGKYTEVPVQTQFGWHVILLEDVRDTKIPSLEEAKPQIAQALQQQQFTKTIQDLRAKAKVD
jgi:peptidyl-prolyl cis-trans isomerase C